MAACEVMIKHISRLKLEITLCISQKVKDW